MRFATKVIRPIFESFSLHYLLHTKHLILYFLYFTIVQGQTISFYPALVSLYILIAKVQGLVVERRNNFYIITFAAGYPNNMLRRISSSSQDFKWANYLPIVGILLVKFVTNILFLIKLLFNRGHHILLLLTPFCFLYKQRYQNSSSFEYPLLPFCNLLYEHLIFPFGNSQ